MTPKRALDNVSIFGLRYPQVHVMSLLQDGGRKDRVPDQAAALVSLEALLRAPIFSLGAERRALNLLQQLGVGRLRKRRSK